MHIEQRLGLPTVDLQTRFVHPARLGEILDIAVSRTRLGSTSITLAARATAAGAPRFSATLAQVLIDLDNGRPGT